MNTEKHALGNAADDSGPRSPLYSSPDDGLRGAASIAIAPAHTPGPYHKSEPIASVSGSLYSIDGPARIDGLYNKTRSKRLIAQLNAAHAAAIDPSREIIGLLVNTCEMLKAHAALFNRDTDEMWTQRLDLADAALTEARAFLNKNVKP